MNINLYNGETKFIEYKLKYSKTLLKTVSAFANYHDGYVVVGLDDNGIVVGVENSEAIRLTLENAINDTIEPKPYYEISTESIDGKNVVILKVYKGDHTPYTFNNKTYIRMDTSSVQVDRRGYQELILLGQNQSFETLSINQEELTFDTLSKELKEKLKISELNNDLLITLGLLVNSKYNNAAALLSDKNPIEASSMQLVAYQDNTVKGIKDRQTLENISVLTQYKYCMDFYRKHINMSEIIEGPYRETIEEVPIVAYREAIANLIVHRDYMRNTDSKVEVYSDRVEIISPGGLPIGVTEEDYIDGRISFPRNRIVADIFLRLKIIERLATGIKRIKEYYQDYDVKPIFRVTENVIIVVLPKVNAEGMDTKKYLEIILEDLNNHEQRIFELLKRDGAKTRKEIELKLNLKKTQTSELLRNMRNQDLIVQIGSGRSTKYILSSKLDRV